MADPKQTNSSPGTPARTAEDGDSSKRPEIGGAASGKRIRKNAEEGVTEPLAPEAQGGAGAGRHWPGDS